MASGTTGALLDEPAGLSAERLGVEERGQYNDDLCVVLHAFSSV